MGGKEENMLRAFEKYLKETPEKVLKAEVDKYFPEDKTPKGWVSIEEHLPMMLAMDIRRGCTEYKVLYEDGHEDTSCVSDHNIWYYHAKETGITHWRND